MRRRYFISSFAMLLLDRDGLCSPARADFSGTWQQSDERCVPRRTGDVIRHIENRGSELVVETTAHRGSGPARHAVQRYSMDGTTTVSIGADGDEFHTSVVWSGERLAFSIEEHEDGRVILSKETWTLIEDGSALQVDRENLSMPRDGARKQIFIYVRSTSNPAKK